MTYRYLALGILANLQLACGTAEDQRASTPQVWKALLSDTELSKESVNANFTEAMDALVDANVVASSTASLALLSGNKGEDRDDSQRTRTCVEEEAKAIVTLSTNVDRGFSHQGRRTSIAVERQGTTKLVRTWSKQDGAVACKDEKRADIDMSADITGLSLKAEFERSLSRSFSLSKNLGAGSDDSASSKAKQIKKSVSISAKGSREVNWTAHTANSDGTITRSKSIVSSVSREHKRLDSSGQETVIKLSMEVGKEEPLKVEVTYEGEAKERQLLSKVISSGKIVATRAGDGRIVSSFASLKLDFDGDSCEVSSGEMQSEIYAEGASEPSKRYLLQASEGEYVFQDVTDPSNPLEVEDVEFEVCDLADHKD